MKASKGTSTGSSDVDWVAFNKHLQEVLGEEEQQVAILSGIIDVGIQYREDLTVAYEGKEIQEKALEEGRATLSEDESKLTIQMSPVGQVVLIADFPDLMVNYGKYFAGEDEFKPYRTLVGGSWEGIAKGINMNSKKINGVWQFDPKSTISKLAKFCDGVSGAVPQDYDIGNLLGEAFAMDVGVKDVDGKLYVNAKNVNRKHKMVEVPEHNIEPFGISFGGGNDPKDLFNINGQVYKLLEKAVGWNESGLKKELDAYQAEKEAAKEDKDTPKEAPKKSAPVKKAAPKKAAKAAEPEPEEDEEDDCPF
jgi:hypothetical protein